MEVVDIGFPEQVIDTQGIKVNWTTTTQASQWMPLRPPASHKGTYGRVLVVAGSTGMTGAAALASEAALRAGAGLVTLATPKHLNPILEGLLPEVMTLPLSENRSRQPIGIGNRCYTRIRGKDEICARNRPRNLSTSRYSRTRSATDSVENREHKLGLRMVIDADGLNAIAQTPENYVVLRYRDRANTAPWRDGAINGYPGVDIRSRQDPYRPNVCK